MGKRYYAVALVVCLLALASAFFVGGAVRAHSRRQLDYGEGLVWWQSAHVTDLTAAYKPIGSYPYLVFHYPPVYHLAARWAAGLAGDWIWAARLLSLAAAAGSVAALAILIYSSLPRRAPALYRLAAALFGPCLALSFDAMSFARLARVDSLGLFFSLSGLAVFILSRHSAPGQAAAFALFVLALFTKQTLFAAPAACLLVTFLLRPARALRLAAFAALLGGVPLAWLEAATHGGFLLNTVRYNVNPYSFGLAAVAWSRNLRQALPLAAMAFAEAWLLWTRIFRFAPGAWRSRLRAACERSRYHRAAVVLSFELLFAALGSLAAGKIGSNVNYFMELNFVFGALAGLLLFRLLLAKPRRHALAAPAAVFAVALGAVVAAIPPAVEPLSPPERARDRGAVEAYARALQVVRDTPGRVYSEDMTLLMNAGKEVPAEPAIITSLSLAGQWDETPFVNMILNRKFDAIVVTNLDLPERYTPRVRSAIERAYEPAAAIGSYTFHRPRTQRGVL
jgi:hypothetical protein